MLSEIRIYFEGDKRLPLGFSAFFSELRNRARERRCRFLLIVAGSGDDACLDFQTAQKRNLDAWNILLRDSEEPLKQNASRVLCQK